MAEDFEVLRGSSIIDAGSANLTLSNGVDFTLPAATPSNGWFARITNTHFSGMGRTASGGSQNNDDTMVYLAQDGAGTVDLIRLGTANNTRVDWEIICYVGALGGVNEFIVHQADHLTATATATVSTGVIAAITNNDDCVPFVTGQANNSTGRNNTNRGIFTADIVAKNTTFTRGSAVGNGYVSYAIVEFTGSNWTVHKESYNSAATKTLGFTVADLTKAFIHATYNYVTTGNAGLDDISTATWLSSTTQLSVDSTTSTGLTAKNWITYIVENSASGADAMVVDRTSGYVMAGSGEEEVVDVAITALADLSRACIMGETNKCTGAGTAFPRGFVNFNLTSTTNIRLRQSDNGQTSTCTWEVVSLPKSTAALIVPVGTASETDSAQAVQTTKSLLVAPAAEVDAAQGLTGSKNKAILSADEADSSQPVASSKVLTVSQATETDSALAVTVGVVIESSDSSGYYIPDLRFQAPELYYPNRKPIGEVEIDWDNPLTKGLKFYALLGIGGVFLRELVQDYAVTEPSGGAFIDYDLNGSHVKAVNPENGLGTAIRPVFIDSANKGMSFVTDIKQNSVLTAQWTNPQIASLVKDNQYYFGAYHDWRNPDTGFRFNDHFSSWQVIEYGQLSVGQRFVLGATIKANASLKLWYDGELITDESNSNTISSQTYTSFLVGTQPNNADSDADTSSYMFAAYEGDLDGSKMRALTSDPYQILKPKKPLLRISIPTVDADVAGYFLPDCRLEMPILYYPNRQPVGGVVIDWQNKMSRGLKSLFIGSSGALDIKDGKPFDITGTPEIVTSVNAGLGYDFKVGQNNNLIKYGNVLDVGSGEFTWTMQTRTPSSRSGVEYCGGINVYSPGFFTRHQSTLNGVSWGLYLSGVSADSQEPELEADTVYTLTVSRSASGVFSFYRDGVKIIPAIEQVKTNQVNDGFIVLGAARDGAFWGINTVYFSDFRNVQLSDNEVFLLHGNLFQMLIPK